MRLESSASVSRDEPRFCRTTSLRISRGSMWTTKRPDAATGSVSFSPARETDNASSGSGCEVITRTRNPWPAWRSANARLSEVLPTPPLPQKTVTGSKLRGLGLSDVEDISIDLLHGKSFAHEPDATSPRPPDDLQQTPGAPGWRTAYSSRGFRRSRIPSRGSDLSDVLLKCDGCLVQRAPGEAVGQKAWHRVDFQFQLREQTRAFSVRRRRQTIHTGICFDIVPAGHPELQQFARLRIVANFQPYSARRFDHHFDGRRRAVGGKHRASFESRSPLGILVERHQDGEKPFPRNRNVNGFPDHLIPAFLPQESTCIFCP